MFHPTGGVGGTGEARMSYFKKVVAVPSLAKTGGQLDFGGLSQGNAWLALITFLYVDFFDTTGTLFSMANFVGLYVPGGTSYIQSDLDAVTLSTMTLWS